MALERKHMDLTSIDDSWCGLGVKCVYGFQRLLTEFVALAKNSDAPVRAVANKNLKATRGHILKHAQDIAIKMSISDQAGGSGETSGRRHAVETRHDEPEDEEYLEAVGGEETEGAGEGDDDGNAGEGDDDGKDGEQRDRNAAAAAATEKATVDTHDRTAAAKTARTKTLAQEPSAPQEQPAAGANEESNIPRHTLSELLKWPLSTLAHEVLRLEGALDDSIQAQYDADHALKVQRNRIRGLLNDLQVQKDNLDAAITRTANIATRFQEAEEKWARTVEGLVQELRFERGSATVQREAADRTLRRLEDTMVGLRALIADSISEAVARTRYEIAPWGRMGTFEAGVATAADRGGGGIRLATAPLRMEPAEATGSEDHGSKRPPGLPTPRSPSPPSKRVKGSSEQSEAREPGRGSLAQKSKAAVAPVKGASAIASGTGGRPPAGATAIQQAFVPLLQGAEETPDADAEATAAMQQWLSMVQHTEKADAKGSAKGKEKEDPKWGVGIRKNSRGLFTLELHHSSRWYFGSHTKLPSVRFLCAVAQMVWNQQIPEDKLVLTDDEEEEWTPDLDVARIMHPGVFAVLYLRGACASPERFRAVISRYRTLKDENEEASDEVAFSAAVGLETVADESPAKGKKSVPAEAGGVAFVCAVAWMECKGFDRKTAEASAKEAALLAGANNLGVVLYLAVWKHIVTAATKGHDAAKIELKVAKYFENAKKVAITKEEKSIIHEQVDVLRTWSFDPDAAKKMRALGLYIERGDDRAKAKNRDVSRSRGKKAAAKSADEEGGSQPIVDLDEEEQEES
ncbi:unnamed protein product [Closterium sp. Yama58-4]|nr:unnamed protein product [Closterium sp. Yama58-4]CAI5481786.1 unnamed protein product [Closterium sp. Yama58-4]